MKYRKILASLAGILGAILLVNLACAAVYTLPPKYAVNGRTTTDIWEANSPVVHGLEGYGYNHIDQNGYNNPDGILDGAYALAIGSSHTQALNVNQNQNYCSVYNHYASKQNQPLLYNAGMDGNDFVDILKRFPAAVQQFPDAQYFLIETPFFTFPAQQLQDALSPISYDPAPISNNGFYRLIQSIPLARLVVRQLLETDYSEFDHAFWQASQKEIAPQQIDYATYEQLLTDCFAALRSYTDKPIYLLYHRIPLLTDDGLQPDLEQIDDHELLTLVQSLCEQYDITLIDPNDRYLQNYQQNNTLPYGFHNTVYGQGHLNQTGHALIADMLTEVLP